MHHSDTSTVDRIFKHALAGAFIGMALVGQLTWFDVSAIGSMLKTADNSLLLNLFLAGAMLKGGLLGAAVGTMRLHVRDGVSAKRDTRQTLLARAEAA